MSKITIGILAHVDAGKTTLSEALLYRAGKINSLGRVDKKNSFLDNNEMERERGITIFSKQAEFKTDNYEFTLIDTPGHVDLSAEMERTLQVLDYAILLISASDLVQGHTITLWNKLKQYDIPAFIFINKMDQPDNHRENIMAELKKQLGDSVIDFYDNELTEDCFEEIALASQNEEIFNIFIDNGSIDINIIKDLIIKRLIVPCFFGSALKLEGIEALINAFDLYMCENEYDEAFGGKIYKITKDASGNRLTHIKLTGGSLKVKDILFEDQKINQIRIYSGEKFTTVDKVVAGDVCCLIGPDKTYAGQGVGFETDNNMKLIAPVITYELIVPPDISTRKIYPDIKKLEEQIPEISIVWNERFEKIFLKLMGEVHLEVVTELIKEIIGTVPEFDMGQIIYKETILEPVIGVGHFEPLRHYAEAHLLLEPLPAGSGVVIDSDCSEDLLDKNWQRLIMSNLRAKKHFGVLTGSELTDIKITVINGRAHIKHTEGGDFKQATYRALRQGLMKATSKLLEPYFNFRLSIPTDMIGKVMTDMESLFCKIKPPEIEEAKAYIVGIGPVSTLRTYQSKIDSYTKGKGEISLEFCGYFECHNEEEILSKSTYNPDEDIANPSSSVFCSHGSGVIIPWYEVEKHQHVIDERFNKSANEVLENHGIKKERFDYSIGTDEIDAIIAKTYSSNTNSKKKPYKKKVTKDIYTSKSTSKKFTPKKGVKNLIDGYNVIFAWEDLKALSDINIDSAKDKLIYYMSNFCGMIGEEVIVVFDGYKVKGNKGSEDQADNITVVHTKEGETADNYIEKYVNNNIDEYRINVYSSDGMIQQISRGIGAYIHSSRELMNIYQEKEKELRDNYLNQ